jgi:signal transduction histidine kinase/ActR/RegA family two-component response regulator
MTEIQSKNEIAGLQEFLDRASAMELAKRSLVGAPVYTIISLIMVFGTPFLREFGWIVGVETIALVMLGIVRLLFAHGFEARYDKIGEKAIVQFSILTAIQSLTLGVLAGIVIWQYWATQETVLTIVLSAGCIAAGTSALSVRHSAHLIFLACVLGPFGISVMLVGGVAKALLIVGFLVLMAFLVQDGGQARRVYVERLRNHYDEQINQRRIAVEDEAKKRFLSDIGHEIRTPANSIIGLTELLLDEPLEARPRNFVELVQRNSRALLDLIDDIPGSVKSRRDKNQTTTNQLKLHEFIGKILGLYATDALQKNIELVTDLSEAPQSVLMKDESHLEQVLVNLLSNAVKFTEQGRIEVAVHSELLEENEIRLEFEIADTGGGVPSDMLPSLFDPFSESGAKTSGRYGGGGLGLPICKGLVELMGGKISINSEQGEGTTVRFDVVTQVDPSDPVTSNMSLQATGSFAKKYPHNILIVDDDATHREIMSALLHRLGYAPTEAVDGQDAIQAATDGDFDRIFMDLRMPNLNGLEAAGWIREYYDDKAKLRIIALTGDALRETRRSALRAGMDEFLPKPVQMQQLETVLKRGNDDSDWKVKPS